MKHLYKLLTLISLVGFPTYGQDIELFQQFNGRYDYTAIGNTLNQFENNLVNGFCETLPSSQANLTLPSNVTVQAAYLYWAGSGSGDTLVTLNGVDFEATETYTVEYVENAASTLTYFSCYTNITDFIIAHGNTSYELSNLDISDALASTPRYCENRTNFAGWSIYVVYEDLNLPLNQISLFQGLEIINRVVQEKTIILDNLNVLDNDGAKIGFLAWEGDNALNYGESLSINGNVLSNPPLNLSNNAFNGTNTFTNSNTFYNGDLDVYSIQDNISIGDTSATIMMTTGALDSNGTLQADLIILNNIITVLNSQLPDATVEINELLVACASRTIEVDFTVFNVNSTDFLPADTDVTFFIEGQQVASTQTQADIPIGGFETGSISIDIPDSFGDTFTLSVMVDATESVAETNEANNNGIEMEVELIPIPPIIQLEPLLGCDIGFDTAVFDLTEQETNLDLTNVETLEYYTNLEDLYGNIGEILNPQDFQNQVHPQTIYIKLYNAVCFEIAQFDLTVENCPPFVPDGFSPNDDGYNDWFNIQGLYDIFEEHKLLIYNRYGTLIFEGDNNNKWEGKANRGLNNLHKLLPVGTYFYVLYLNDPKYKPLTGWVYMNR